MAGGLLFPDVAGTLAPLMRMRQAEEQNAFQMERARKVDEADAREREAAQYVPAALSGDREALNKVAVASPGTAMKLAPLLERLDAGKAAKLKEDADFITRSGMAILNAPPEQQPQLYARARQEAEASGRNVSQWPTTYDPGWVKFNVDKAMPVAEYYKKSGEGVTFAPPAGGGPAPAGGGVSSNNIGNVRPVGGGPQSGFQQPASLEDGIRLAVNNVKAYPAKFNNGQPMTLLQIGERWAPRGDGANDPVQWARNVASIGGLDPTKPLNFNDPQTAAAFARGVHGAEHGANKVLPLQQYAQAITGSATPPGLAQGSDMPADSSGNPIQTTSGDIVPRDIMKSITPLLQPGTALGIDNKTKQYKVQDGHFIVYDMRTSMPVGLIPVPKPPKEQGAGPFAGNSVEAQALNMLIANGTLTQPQAAELAAGKTITNPADGSVLFMTPSGLFGQRPGQAPQPVGGGAPGGQAPQAGAPPAAAPGGPATQPGMIQVTPGKPTGQPTPKELQDIRTARAEADVLIKSLEDFRAEAKNASIPDRVMSATGATTGLNTSYNIAALLAKGEALFNLGVLNGPDLDIIRRTLPDPSTFRGGSASRDSVNAAVDKVVGIIKSKVEAREKQLGITPPAAAAAPAPAAPKPPQGGAERGRVLFEARDAIAKGADPAKVKERLKSLGIEDEP